MLVDETSVGDEQATPPTVAVAPVRNPVPVIPIAVPPAVDPNVGDTEETVGALMPTFIVMESAFTPVPQVYLYVPTVKPKFARVLLV
jgi:hypothetical protein